MRELAYANGTLIPAAELHLSVADWGFVQGVTLTEQLRTFGGKLFHVREHLERLQNGLRIVDWPALDTSDVAAAIEELVRNNHQQIDPRDDLGVSVFVTPGIYPSYQARELVKNEHQYNLCIHTFPLSFHLWFAKYQQGASVVTVETRQVPADCWPAELKCRSRMHYYLAAQEANRRCPGATALLLDHDGFVSETPTANVVALLGQAELISPPREKILPGVSLGYVEELASQMGIRVMFRDVSPSELASADEIMLASTPFCLLPVVEFNGRSLGGPGTLYRKLLSSWSDAVRVDIAGQATLFSGR